MSDGPEAETGTRESLEIRPATGDDHDAVAAFTVVTARKPTRFSGGRKRVSLM